MKHSEDEQRKFLVKTLPEMLAIQCGLAEKTTLDAPGGNINRRALGYVCGFCEAAFQVAWKQKSDRDKDQATIAEILIAMYGMRGSEYMNDALSCINQPDTDFKAGLVNGGQEYIQWARTTGKPNSFVPMGLVKHLNGW